MNTLTDMAPPVPESSSPKRTLLVVPLSAVRPPLWETATREVLESELQRRGCIQEALASHIPFFADHVMSFGMTPEEAETKAVAAVREAEQMLKQVEDAGSPSSVVLRFKEHLGLMRMQTAEAPFRAGKPFPHLVLVDGAHRWHIAVRSGEDKMYVSVPTHALAAYCAQYRHDGHDEAEPYADAGLRDEHIRDNAGRLHVEAAADEVMKSTGLGIHCNYVSHTSSPMTVADCVFSIQSWFQGAVQACTGDVSDFKRQMTPHAVAQLVVYSASLYKDGSIRLGTEQKRLAKFARRKWSALSAAAFPQAARNGKLLILPHALSVIVPPSASRPFESIRGDVEDLVYCAVQNCGTPMSRVLVGFVLRGVGRDLVEEVVDVDVKSSFRDRCWSLPLKTTNCVRVATAAGADFAKEITETRNPPKPSCRGPLGIPELTLMLCASVQSLIVEDLCLVEGVHVHQARKKKSLFAYNLPRKDVLMKAIISVCLQELHDGAPLGKLCTRLEKMKAVSGSARLAMGQTVGWKIDRQDFSCLLRSGVGGVFRALPSVDGYERQRQMVESHSVTCVLTHSVTCFLTHVPMNEGGVAVDATRTSVGGAVATGGDTCGCDFFTDAATKQGKALTHAFFLSRNPISNLYADPAEGSHDTIRRNLSQEELRRQMSRLRNERQGEDVRRAGNRVREYLDELEAAITARNESWIDDTPAALAARRHAILQRVQGVLKSLTELAIEAGLAYVDETKRQFNNTVACLRNVDALWRGTDNIPGLEDAHLRFEAVGLDKDYRDAVTSFSDGSKCADTTLPCDDFDVVSLWRGRVRVHEVGTDAMNAVEEAQKCALKTQRRATAQARKNASLVAGTGDAGGFRRSTPALLGKRTRAGSKLASSKQVSVPKSTGNPVGKNDGAEKRDVGGGTRKSSRGKGKRGAGGSPDNNKGQQAKPSNGSGDVPVHDAVNTEIQNDAREQPKKYARRHAGPSVARVATAGASDGGANPVVVHGGDMVQKQRVRSAPGKFDKEGDDEERGAVSTGAPQADAGGRRRIFELDRWSSSLLGNVEGKRVSSDAGESLGKADDGNPSAGTVVVVAGDGMETRVSPVQNKTPEENVPTMGPGPACVNIEVTGNNAPLDSNRIHTESLPGIGKGAPSNAAGHASDVLPGAHTPVPTSENERAAQALLEVVNRNAEEAARVADDTTSLTFRDIVNNRPPRRIQREATAALGGAKMLSMHEVFPRTLSHGCNTKYFVDPADMKSIRTEMEEQDMYPRAGGPLKDFVRELELTGVAIIRGVFSAGRCSDDIDLIIDAACHSLELVHGTPEDGKRYDASQNFQPIPNLGGGGRSMTTASLWARLENCATKHDEKIARASHRHLVRACVLVESLMMSDNQYSECRGFETDRDTRQKNVGAAQSVVDHQCANTGGRILMTHPPDGGASSGEGGNAASTNLFRGALPQRPHIDFRKPTRTNQPDIGHLPSRNRETPMFVICTGKAAAALRVYKGSHLWALGTREVHAVGVRSSEVDVVHVPPYSFLIMRGDCYHAGAGWLESKWANDALGVKVDGNENFMRGIARWHAYFRTTQSAITNAVHYAQDASETVFPDDDKMHFPDVESPYGPDKPRKRHLRTREDFTFDMEDVK